MVLWCGFYSGVQVGGAVQVTGVLLYLGICRKNEEKWSRNDEIVGVQVGGTVWLSGVL